MRPKKRLPDLRSGFPLMALVLSMLVSGALAIPVLARQQGEDDPELDTLRGTFTVSIEPGDIPSALAEGDALVGRWKIDFGDDGGYSLTRQDVGEVAHGAFTAGPASLAFENWSGIIGCSASDGDSASASYAWQLSDDRLTLTPIDDACAERLTLLTTRALVHIDACEIAPVVVQDPFSMIEGFGTPAAENQPVTGVAAQEGFSEGVEVERAIDDLLRSANGCWAVSEPDSFMALHSQGLTSQIAMMGPPEAFTRELRSFMEAPLTLERIGDVTLDDPNHAWAYVEIDLGGQANPQRVNFVLEQGVWRFDTFFLFGPPIPGVPPEIAP